MTFDRAQLIEDYIQRIIGTVYDTMQDNLTTYTDEQLITEVKEYDPELLGE
jgi:hypothetical protein